MTSKQREEFEEAARPLIKYIAENFHPHTHAYVDSGGAEVSEGLCAFNTDEYIPD